MLIKEICYYCSGDGLVHIDDDAGGPGEDVTCTVCGGSGELLVGTIDELDDLRDTINDILNKCNDIFEKENE